MNPLMMLMSGCFGSGYSSYGMSADTMNTFNNIWATTSWMTAIQCGMPGMLGTMGGIGSTTTTTETSNCHQSQCCTGTVSQSTEGLSSAELKVQQDAAEKEYNTLSQLCTKVEEYKNDKEATETSLSATVVAKRKALIQEQEELDRWNKDPDTNKEAIRTSQSKVKNAEKELQNAEIAYDAFILAQKEKEAEYQKVLAQREAAYAKYNQLSTAYLNALNKENMAQNVVNDRADDKKVTGKWWNRTALNPTNWFNKKGTFWGETTNNANIAKCLRILQKSGRSEALLYAYKHGLIKFEVDPNTNKRVAKLVNVNDTELQGLVDLYNGKDKVAPDPLDNKV